MFSMDKSVLFDRLSSFCSVLRTIYANTSLGLLKSFGWPSAIAISACNKSMIYTALLKNDACEYTRRKNI